VFDLRGGKNSREADEGDLESEGTCTSSLTLRARYLPKANDCGGNQIRGGGDWVSGKRGSGSQTKKNGFGERWSLGGQQKRRGGATANCRSTLVSILDLEHGSTT